MLIFDPKTGFKVDEVSTVREQVRQAWINAFKAQGQEVLNTDASTPQGQLIDSQTASIVQKDSEILYLANQFNPLKAEGVFQDALAQIYFLTRQPAINSRAICTCTGRAGTTIPKGSIIQSEIDGIQWEAIETKIISNSSVDVTFQCTQSGAVVAGPNSLTLIVTVIPGWDGVTNQSSAITGSLEETQGAFEARRYASVALNSRSSIAAIYANVGQVLGVISLYAIDNKSNEPVEIDGVTLGPHSVFVSVLGGTDEEVAEAIVRSISAGCDYNGETEVTIVISQNGALEKVKFNRPADYPLQMQVRVRKNAALPANAEQLIKDAIIANFYGTGNDEIAGEPLLRIKQGDDIYSSRFYTSILNQGITDILSILIAIKTEEPVYTEFLHVPIDKNPILATDDIEVVIEEALSAN